MRELSLPSSVQRVLHTALGGVTVQHPGEMQVKTVGEAIDYEVMEDQRRMTGGKSSTVSG